MDEQKRSVDFLNVDAAFLRGFGRIGNFKQFAGCLLRIRIRALVRKPHFSMPHATANPAISIIAMIVRLPIRFKFSTPWLTGPRGRPDLAS